MSRHVFKALRVVLCAGFALCASSLTQAAGVAVRGRVLGPGDAAVAQARVTLSDVQGLFDARLAELSGTAPAPLVSGVSAADGSFRIAAPAPGFYVVRVEAPGFVAEMLRLEPLVEDLDLPLLRLEVAEPLAVRVQDTAGAPIAGALVTMVTAPERGPGARLAARSGVWMKAPRVVTTDAAGIARIARATSETGKLAVVARGHSHIERPAPRGTSGAITLQAGERIRVLVRDEAGKPVPNALVALRDEGTLPLGLTHDDGIFHFADVVDPDDPPRIVVTAASGASTSATIARAPLLQDGTAPLEAWIANVTLPPPSSVTGRVIDALDRRGLPGALVWIDGAPWLHATAQAGGAFRIDGLEASRAGVLAAARSYLAADSLEARSGTSVDSSITLALKPAAAIEGLVVDESGEPVQGALITAHEDQGRSDRIMIRIGGGGPTGATATSGPDGRFRLAPLDAEQSWRLEAKAPGYARTSAAAPTLRPRETARDVRLEVSRGSAVFGRVADTEGRAIAGVTASLAKAAPEGGPRLFVMPGARSDADPTLAASSGSDGSFVIEGVAAGRYTLKLARAGYASLETAALTVTDAEPRLDAGDHVLEPGSSIAGRVVDERGTPIEGAFVHLQIAGGFSMPMLPGMSTEKPAAVTGPDGWFTIPDRRPGEKVALTITASGYVQARVPAMDVPPASPLEVAMDPSSRVSGTVTSAQGEPLAGARVELTRTTGGAAGGASIVMRISSDTETDAAGVYRFEDIAPGEIELAATATGHKRVTRALEVPRGADLENADIPLEAGAWIAGRVLESDGRPAIGAEVGAVSEGEFFGPGPGGATTDGDGRFLLEGLDVGPIAIEARGEGERRAVRDLELRAGENALELRFPAGVSVSGLVTDAAGAPVGGAWVRLAPADRPWFGSEEKTAADGRFRFASVDPGTFSLSAGASGHALAEAKTVTVSDSPIDELALRLRRGGTIDGTVRGLDRDLLSKVAIRAFYEGGEDWRTVPVDSEGRFQIDGVAPGSWSLTGDVEGTGKRAQASVRVAEEGGLATVELEFGTGLTLSGTVTQDDRALGGVSVLVRGLSGASGGATETDGAGRFALEGLSAGPHRVQIQDWQTGLSHGEEIDVDGDREIDIEIPTTSVSGIVVDALGDEPLSGVSLALEREGAAEGGPTGSLFGSGTTSDLDGRFRIAPVGPGRYRLTASKKGYALASKAIEVRGSSSLDDVDLRLDPTDGVVLDLAFAAGGAPDRATVAVLDASGAAILAGEYGTGERGRVRVASVPPGTWEVVVNAGGSASVSTRVDAPGGPFPIALPAATQLAVRVPELEGAGTSATMRIVGASDGRSFREAGAWEGVRSEWPLRDGNGTVRGLPPGRWRVTVSAADGRTWSGEIATAAAAPATLTLSS